MTLTYGSLFAGYGGLEMGVSSVLGGELAWYAEFDKAPAAIMAHHHPGVTNYGDVTKVDWASVPKVDVITGGSPCQDLSHAGKRAGMKAGTRSGLWASMCDAIETIRPKLVVWENVRGALSAEADSAVEPCQICVGDGGRVTLRALGRVLGDLAELGYELVVVRPTRCRRGSSARTVPGLPLRHSCRLPERPLGRRGERLGRTRHRAARGANRWNWRTDPAPHPGL